MKKYILLIIFGLSFQHIIKAQNVTAHEKLTREADYIIKFPCINKMAELLHVKCVYDDTKIDSCYSVFLNDNKDDANPDFILSKQLDFRVFAIRFSEVCKAKLRYPISPSMTTLYDVSRLIWGIKNFSNDDPEAGVLKFNYGVLVFENNRNKYDQFSSLLRRRATEVFSNTEFDKQATLYSFKDNLKVQLKDYTKDMPEIIDSSLSIKKKLNSDNNKVCIQEEEINKTFSFKKSQHDIDVATLRSAYDTIRNPLFQQRINLLFTKKNQNKMNKIIGDINKIEANYSIALEPLKKKLDTLRNQRDSMLNAIDYDSIKKDIEDLKKYQEVVKSKGYYAFDFPLYERELSCGNIKNIENELDNYIQYLKENLRNSNLLKEELPIKDPNLISLKALDTNSIDNKFQGISNSYYKYFTCFKGKYIQEDCNQQKDDTSNLKQKFGVRTYEQIKKLELKFERGFLENVKVWLDIDNTEYIFENIFAVGFSSVNNFRRIEDTKLFVRNGPKDSDSWYIYLGDIFRPYDNRLNNYTRDYSPADTSILISPSTVQEITLRKEKYINIIDAKGYVDLKGIDKTKPNGIIQIELSKRFNINTARLQAGSTRADFGFFNYLDLFGSLSKIEQNNKQLVLQNANLRDINNKLISPSYATNLDFLRFENYSVGVNLGILLFDKPDYKFTAYLDFGIKYGHAIISDSVLVPSGNYILPFSRQLEAHTITFQFPKISIELFPESRITPRLSWQLNQTKLFSNNQYKQVVSNEKSDVSVIPLEKRAGFSNQYEIYVKMAPDKDRTSHMFVRWRFFTQFGDANTSFSQFQIGYAFNWTSTK